MVSNKLLMPLRPSQPDIWTLAKMDEIISQVSTVNEELECLLLMNQVPPVSRDRLRQAMEVVMADFGRRSACSTRFGCFGPPMPRQSAKV